MVPRGHWKVFAWSNFYALWIFVLLLECQLLGIVHSCLGVSGVPGFIFRNTGCTPLRRNPGIANYPLSDKDPPPESPGIPKGLVKGSFHFILVQCQQRCQQRCQKTPVTPTCGCPVLEAVLVTVHGCLLYVSDRENKARLSHGTKRSQHHVMTHCSQARFF